VPEDKASYVGEWQECRQTMYLLRVELVRTAR